MARRGPSNCYASRLVAPDPRLLMIGHESNQHMPLHAFYDLDHLARDDARVTLRHEEGGDLHDQFETLREMIAWGKMLVHRAFVMGGPSTSRLRRMLGEISERSGLELEIFEWAPPLG